MHLGFSWIRDRTCVLLSHQGSPRARLFTRGPASLLLQENEKVGLKLNIQKTKIMASSPITSWQIDGQAMETVTDFILGGSKITVDGDCRHEIKRNLLLGRKVMTNLDSIFKSRDIANKGPSRQRYYFSSSHVGM